MDRYRTEGATVDQRLSRNQVRAATACPACGARVGEQCVGVRGKPREANHAERVQAAEMALGTTREARNAERRARIMRDREAIARLVAKADVESADSVVDLESHAG